MSFSCTNLFDSLKGVDKKLVSFYVGELKKENAFVPLNMDSFIVRECDQDGMLLKMSAENLVNIEAIPCKNENNEVSYYLNCLKCNEASDTMRQCLTENSETEELVAKSFEFCIHTAAIHKLNPKGEVQKKKSTKLQAAAEKGGGG